MGCQNLNKFYLESRPTKASIEMNGLKEFRIGKLRNFQVDQDQQSSGRSDKINDSCSCYWLET
jgi:hypothetical protein